VRGDLADRALPDRLAARGADVREVAAYRTIEGPADADTALQGALHASVLAWTFASGSAVRGLIALAGDAAPSVLERPALCIGLTTARVARAVGFGQVLVAQEPTDAALADLAAASLAVPT
jgi:uroporphyrinogen-III synthase